MDVGIRCRTTLVQHCCVDLWTGIAACVCVQEIPPYNNFGSLEDSLQSCLSLRPMPPKKDYVKMLENDHKTLRFEAVMVPAILACLQLSVA